MTPQASRTIPPAEAARIWTLYGFSSPQDLVLEDLAMAMGIIVVDARLDSAAARLLRSGDRGLMRVSDAIRQPSRRRFAIAHEIGHWVLHKNVSQLLACTEQDMVNSYKSSAYEIEASSFAGALLMPEQLFVKRVAHARPMTRVLSDLATCFETSLTATAHRYIETTNDYHVLVISEKNCVRWWRASESFANHNLWIDNGTTLPKYSAAAHFFRGEPVPTTPQKIDFADWFGSLPGVHSQSVIEQAIPLTEFGQVLSMLWLP